ncbi:MAG: 3-isopropylmalate dehydratase small subunit [Acidimicrobiia bacterium]
MQQVTQISSTVVPLDRSDVDTDQIIPAVWLKRVERTGFGEGLFSAWRDDPEFILNKAEYKNGHVLVARENFGCGSSREHAPWALQDYGFEAVIAPSFADIFRNNCLKLGLVPVVASKEDVEKLLELALENSSISVDVNVETKTWSCEQAGIANRSFDLDEFSQYRMLNGLDDIGITLQHSEDISNFELTRPTYKPSL